MFDVTQFFVDVTYAALVRQENQKKKLQYVQMELWYCHCNIPRLMSQRPTHFWIAVDVVNHSNKEC